MNRSVPPWMSVVPSTFSGRATSSGPFPVLTSDFAVTATWAVRPVTVTCPSAVKSGRSTAVGAQFQNAAFVSASAPPSFGIAPLA